MKNSTLQARVIIFTASEPDQTYTFRGLQFSGGAVCVSYDNTNDGWFESAEQVDACGTDVITEITELDEFVEWTLEQVRESIEGSKGEFGVTSVPDNANALLLK